MAVQWTVSFSKNKLNEKGLSILESFEFVEFERAGIVEIDMSEEDFFPFAEEMAAARLKFDEDGSNSWGKHI
jgi:hypothetical protein